MRKTIFATVLAAGLFFNAAAQQKIGHLNSLDILQSMPEFKAMQADLQKQKDAFTKVLEGLYSDYDKKQKELQTLANDKTTPDAILDMKVKELQDLQVRISEFEDKVNNDLQKMQSDKLKPINDKYLKAVKEVAQANGYAYIIDIVSGAVAYYPESQNDVTQLVAKQLGITITPAPQTSGTELPKTGGKQ
ncbi:MAG: OmpH family outer membrane protein [Chitinophagales bacterium]|nr:OmpH family outer membrane protein [Chitinophagales bacterium]MDW8418659.1 OmpH family outer membrane protein [Chitinophagales bacterium]